MTIDQLTPTDPSPVIDLTGADPTEGYDFYREIHKGIRLAMVEHLLAVGRLDVTDEAQVDRVLAGQETLFDLLDMHHSHEDVHVQPLVVEHAPDLARLIESQHEDVDDGIEHLRLLGERLGTAATARRGVAAHRLYLDLSELTGLYLQHVKLEEERVMPALRAAVPTDELLALDRAIRAGIPPAAMATTLGFVLRALNPDERTALAADLAMAPPEVYAGFLAVVRDVLPVDEAVRTAGRPTPA